VVDEVEVVLVVGLVVVDEVEVVLVVGFGNNGFFNETGAASGGLFCFF